MYKQKLWEPIFENAQPYVYMENYVVNLVLVLSPYTEDKKFILTKLV